MPYQNKESFLSHECIIKGDDQYISISAASILAKVHHDDLILKHCNKHPRHAEEYDWRSNMCYGTYKHMTAIRELGITPFHRKSFGICRAAFSNRGEFNTSKEEGLSK